MMETKSQTKNKNKKQALGRGLGSLLGVNSGVNPISQREEFIEKEVSNQIDESLRVWQIAIDKLIPNKKQPRKTFETGALKSLSDSIKEKGIIQPILAKRLSSDRFEIIAGERRWRAAQAAGLHEVPVVLKGVDEQGVLELALIENIQREDLNVIEEAQAYQFLIDEYQLTQQELALRIGKDRASIANTVRLLNLSPLVQQMVSESELSKGQAKILAAISDEKIQLKVAKEIVTRKMSVRAAEKLIAKINKKGLGSVTPSRELDLSQKLAENLSQELQKILGTKVSIHYKKGQGQLSIHYYSDDELNQLVDKLRETWQS